MKMTQTNQINQTTQLPLQFAAVSFTQGNRSLSVTYAGQTKLFTDQLPYFNLVKETFEDNPQLVVENLDALLVREGHLTLYKGQTLPAVLEPVIQDLTKRNLPADPVLLFWEKAQQTLKASEILTLFTSQPKIELTWTGDLVMYARTSWLEPQTLSWDSDWISNFVPLEQVRTTKPVRLGTFEWVTQTCPDAGVMYEMAVDPQYITEVNKMTIKTTQYQSISQLNERRQEGNGLLLLSRELNQYGQYVLVREPYSPEAARRYVQSSLTHNLSLDSVGPETIKTGSC